MKESESCPPPSEVPQKWSIRSRLLMIIVAGIVATSITGVLVYDYVKRSSDSSSDPVVVSHNNVTGSVHNHDSSTPIHNHDSSIVSAIPAVVDSAISKEPQGNYNDHLKDDHQKGKHPLDAVPASEDEEIGPRMGFGQVGEGRENAQTGPIDSPIINHGGPIMNQPMKINILYYGNFSLSSRNLLQSFINGLGQSKWWGISSKYGATSNITLGTVLQKPAISKRMTDQDVYNHVRNSSWQLSPNDMYFVLTDSSVDQPSGMCINYCGWHSFYKSTNSKTKITQEFKFGYIGSTIRCPDACSVFNEPSNSPNGDFEMDSMIAVLAHEITETATDPTFRTWYNEYGEENADLCAWQFGNIADNGGKLSNVLVGNRNFLLQQNLDPTTQTCAN